MRAAVLEAVGQPPTVREFDEPTRDVVRVSLAGCNPVDLAMASGEMGDPVIPSVVGTEGIVRTADGTRVYFDSPVSPFGSWAELAQLDPDLAFEVPDDVDDDLAVALGIAGLAAWLPLTRHADVSAGQSVLILGATGIVGNIAIQAAKILGAGRVVGAGRDAGALQKAQELGADAVVQLGTDDDAAALKSEVKDGYDVVVDLIYGDPFLAALDATTVGATLITVGQGAGTPAIPFAKLMGRTHIGHMNNLLPASVMRQAYAELVGLASEKRLTVETTRYSLDDAEKAWDAQADSPHVKIGIAP
ncbi:quinone oxidoreductase family protein [Mycolicibacterium gilvum]|uniref:quinone oxidoreductase family protein n=1 Tax=Mycolicibacterium gilvum TaxID=1804 RepID=UPI0040465D4E